MSLTPMATCNDGAKHKVNTIDQIPLRYPGRMVANLVCDLIRRTDASIYMEQVTCKDD